MVRRTRRSLQMPAIYAGGVKEYYQRLLSIQRASLLAFWPLWETEGSQAADLSGNELNGAYSAVTLGQDGIGDGGKSALFDGSTSVCDIYSAGLAQAFDPDLFSMALWVKVAADGVWVDGATRRALNLRVNGSNFYALSKSNASNQLSFTVYRGGTSAVLAAAGSGTGWIHLCGTLSAAKDRASFYVNGEAVEPAAGSLGAWAGDLAADTCCIGAGETAEPANVWSGCLAHAAIWKAELSAADVARLLEV